MSTTKTRNAVLSVIKKHGAHIVPNTEQVERRSTGSLVFDYDIGGGWPKGRMVEIYGPPNTGKTLTALLTCKAAIDNNERVLFVDIERTLDMEWLARLGLETTKTDENGNPYWDAIQPTDAETALEIIKEILKANHYNLIVIDTIAVLSPKAEQEATMDKTTQIGLQAKLMTRFCRVIGDPLARSDTTIIALNQVREDLSSQYAGKTSTGGHGFWHFISIRIQTLSPNQTYRNGNKRDRIDFLEVRWKMKKSKVCDFNEETHSFTLAHLEDGRYIIDPFEEVFEMAKNLNLFCDESGDEVWSGRGNSYYKDGGEIVVLGNGKPGTITALHQNPQLAARIRARIMGNDVPVGEGDNDE